MERFEFSKYRGDLVKEIKEESNKENRREILQQAKATEEYKEARNFKLENTNVGVDFEQAQETEQKYSPEAIREDIKLKAEKIRAWAEQTELAEGKDFLVIESIADVEIDTDAIAPHELKQFFVLVQEVHYRKFKDYILGQYTEERKKENPTNKYGAPKLDYSWGGRFMVGWDGVPFDTVATSSIEHMTVPTHHEEFKTFFKQKAGFDFPTSETLNPILQEMSKKGLDTYKLALTSLKELREQNTLPDDGYGLIDAMEHMIMILEDAKTGEALIDLPEVLDDKMPAKMRHYADLTYNAEDVRDFERVREITGITIPDEVRLDMVFNRYGFDRARMESICRDFSDYILLKRDIGKTVNSRVG